MNDVERERMRERILRLVREEPEVVAGLLLGLMDGGRFEVVIREERVEGKDLPQLGFSSWETSVVGYEIEMNEGYGVSTSQNESAEFAGSFSGGAG